MDSAIFRLVLLWAEQAAIQPHTSSNNARMVALSAKAAQCIQGECMRPIINPLWSPQPHMVHRCQEVGAPDRSAVMALGTPKTGPAILT